MQDGRYLGSRCLAFEFQFGLTLGHVKEERSLDALLGDTIDA